MSEEKDIVTKDEQDDTTNGSKDDSTEGSEVSTETLEVQKRKALKQRDEEREKNEELQKKLDELGEKVESPKEVQKVETPKSNTPDDVTLLKDEVKTIKFVQANPNLDSDSIKEVLEFANGRNITPEKALESPVIKAFLKEKEAEAAVNKATPSNNRSLKVPPPEELGNIATDKEARKEHKKWFNEVVGNK
jgi:hypothetical protein